VEAVYNGFAIGSWPLFVLLAILWKNQFNEKPNWFDLGCHLAMATMVFGRFYTYPGNFQFTTIGMAWIAVAIAGYALFNISIKLSKGHRPTNVGMNIGGGLLLAAASLVWYGGLNVEHLEWKGIALGGLSILGIVWALGKSYAHFGAQKKASLVAPLVYDGLLVTAPLLSLATGEPTSWTSGLAVGFGMLLITFVRWRYHSRQP